MEFFYSFLAAYMVSFLLSHFDTFFSFAFRVCAAIFGCVQNLWLIETKVVFIGNHCTVHHLIPPVYIPWIYQALIASIILSGVIALITVFFDRKYDFLVQFRTKSFTLLYVLVAKITALAMIDFGLLKIFLSHFENANQPDMQMSSAGSFVPLGV